MLRRSGHSFSALTDIVVSRIDSRRMMLVFDEFPRVGAAILWASARDDAMLVEHLVSLGRRSALIRTGHFFLELCERLQLVGLATQTEFDCPLNQYALADALGLSAIHVNRVLRQLRDRRLLTLRRGRVVIHDPMALRQLTGFACLDTGHAREFGSSNGSRDHHFTGSPRVAAMASPRSS